jgi:DNA-binding CsgD family transcriptional regulator
MSREQRAKHFAQINAERAKLAAKRYAELLRLSGAGHTIQEMADIEGTSYHATRVALHTAKKRANV